MRFRLNIFNIYDFMLILMLGFLATGIYGGAYSPTRLMAMVFSVFLIPSLNGILHGGRKISNYSVIFAVVVFFYVMISYAWSLDAVQGAKELVYYPVHMLLLLEIIWFSKKAKVPMFSICLGWAIALAITVPIGLREVFLDVHLDVSKLQGDAYSNMGEGLIIMRKFASATFGNYNGYVIFILPSMLFIMAGMMLKKNILIFLAYSGLLLYGSMILLINASRGGIVTLGIMGAIFFVYYFRSKMLFKKILGFLLICGGAVLFYKFSDQLLFQIEARMINSSFLSDEGRLSLILDGLRILFNSFLMGAGIGSVQAAYEQINGTIGVSASHNLIMEIIIQYGLLIVGMFLFLLYKIAYSGWKNPNLVSRFVVAAFILSFPAWSIIDSLYLLSPILWSYLGSVCVFAELVSQNADVPMRKFGGFPSVQPIPPMNFLPIDEDIEADRQYYKDEFDEEK